jgi:hypothetical protein
MSPRIAWVGRPSAASYSTKGDSANSRLAIATESRSCTKWRARREKAQPDQASPRITKRL